MAEINYPIRELTPADEKMAMGFYDQMGGESRGFFNVDDGNRNHTLRFLHGECKNEAHFAMTITENGVEKMIGYVFLWNLDSSVPWLGIAVRDEWKGKHVGRALIAYLEEYTRKRGYAGMLLTTAQANVRGQSLYTRMGFERMGLHVSGEFLFLKRYAHE